jgi:hypothetical protein
MPMSGHRSQPSVRALARPGRSVVPKDRRQSQDQHEDAGEADDDGNPRVVIGQHNRGMHTTKPIITNWKALNELQLRRLGTCSTYPGSSPVNARSCRDEGATFRRQSARESDRIWPMSGRSSG